MSGKMKLGFIICTIFLVAAAALAFGGLFQAMGDSYENEKEYTAGDAEITGTVKNLDINWTNGKIKFEYHSADTIELHEQAKKTISGDMQMRWWLDGDTLRVQYAKSGFRMFLGMLQKELTVTLPEGISFENVDLHGTSADFEIPSLNAKTVDLHVTSGDISASADAENISIEATSGDIFLKSGEKAETVSAEVSSGSISIEAGDAENLKVSSTSGDVRVAAGKVGDFSSHSTSGTGMFEIKEAENAQIQSTSGDIAVRFEKLGILKIDGTSSDVTALLPEKPGFTAKLENTSGDINYSLPMSVQDSSYICGDGSGSVEIHTTSGDILLEAA